MFLSQVEGITTSAVQKRRVVEVRYSQEDGTLVTHRLEPFDVSPMKYARTGGLKLWGWCRDTGRIEQYSIDRIAGIKPTEETFDPRVREQTFATPPKYRIYRDW